MRGMKHGIRVLGLVVLALVGTMAVGAGGAQGQTLPEASALGSFLINLGSALLATFTGELLGPLILLVAARQLKIECMGLDVEEGKINSSTDAQAKFILLGCISFTHAGVHLPDCLFKELGMIRLSVLILPILHGGSTFLLFEPIPPSTILSTPSYKSGTPCTLPLNNPITGSFTALVKTLDSATQTLLFSQTIQLLTADILSFGGFPAYMSAEADFKLADHPSDKKLGIH
jgi:hypothetical protein